MQVFSGVPDGVGYDHLIGTSDKGSPVAGFKMPKFKKAIIVFGGYYLIAHGLIVYSQSE